MAEYVAETAQRFLELMHRARSNYSQVIFILSDPLELNFQDNLWNCAGLDSQL